MSAAPAVAESVATGHRVTFADKPTYHSSASPTLPLTSSFASSQPVVSRPTHHRRRSRTGHSSSDVVSEIASAFRRAFPKRWASETGDYARLGRDFFAAAIGLSAGFRIHAFALSRSDTAVLALELSRIMNTTDLILLLDSSRGDLYVLHTQILNARLHIAATDDQTVFMRIGKNAIMPIAAEDVTYLPDAMHHLSRLFRHSSRQVFATTDFGWPSSEVQYRMLTLGDWLLAKPVCFVLDPARPGPCDLEHHLERESCYTIQVQAEGISMEHDHVFEPCQAPMSLFPDATDTGSFDRRGLRDSTRSIHDIQDRVQTIVFDRLNGNEKAASLWADVICSITAPSHATI